jgi:hypothetical protein
MRLIDLVTALPHKEWKWSELSWNPNITFQDVLENPDKPWDWYGLSMNRNITMKDVLENPDKPWNWYHLSWHQFGYQKPEENPERIQERIRVIKEELMEKAWHPRRLPWVAEWNWSK